jgi:hypothetical protein
LFIISFPKPFIELEMTRQYTLFDDFQALPQVIGYLMGSHATVHDQVRFGQAFLGLA